MIAATSKWTFREKVLWVLLVLVVSIFSKPGIALPEFTRLGYFSCTSCHVSPSGGGLLTPYGRSVASEKLATWRFEGEEKALYALGESTPDWLLLGGNFRQIQTYYEGDRSRNGRFFTMQRDLEIGFVKGRYALVGTIGLDSGPEVKKPSAVYRRYFAKVDLNQNISVRIGRFFPKYGLMIPNHNAAIRKNFHFDQGMETDNFEVTFFSQKHEVTATAISGRVNGGGKEDLVAKKKGAAVVWAAYLINKHRFALNVLSHEDDFQLDRVTGVNGAFKTSDKTWWLFELDGKQSRLKSKNKVQKSVVSYNRVGYELARGIFPFFLHELSQSNLEDGTTRADVNALGMQWHPRPHFEIEGVFGQMVKPSMHRYSVLGYLTFHYYL